MEVAMDVVEVWRDIPGLNGLYKMRLSDCSIRSEPRETKTGVRGGSILVPYPDDKGYMRVGLTINGKTRAMLLHRIIAETIIPNPENKPCIDHINGNTSDNRPENLRWVTYAENMNNPITKTNISKPRPGSRGKFAYQAKAIICIDTGEFFWGTKEVERKMYIAAPNIRSHLAGRLKTVGGYRFRYATHEEITTN